MSEEFLRRYQQDKESVHSTLGEVVAPGESLFDTAQPRDKSAHYREAKAGAPSEDQGPGK